MHTTEAEVAMGTTSTDSAPEPPGGEAGAPGETKAERSSIKFPYTDIDDAVLVATMIKEKHGSGPMPLDQLAAALGGSSIKSGAFRTKLATAGTFGAVKSSRGHVELTDLGHRLADEHTRPVALAESFMKVPLYKRIYDDYVNRSLPGDTGLENEIHRLGVVANQADRARQAFQRSADKAGFFWNGRSRLIMPLASTLGKPGTAPPQEDTPPPPEREEDVLSNALLAALFKKMLPAESEQFTAKDRRRFFHALAVNLDVIYGEPEDGEFHAEKLVEVFQVAPNSPTRASS